MKDSLLNGLNQAQAKAVTHIENPLLVLAGAGSGKTKMLTTRLVYLIKEVGIPPENTLTLTFTNKAANEMRERAFNILQKSGFMVSNMPLLATFHKFGLIFMRQYGKVLNISPNFILIDSDDKKKIVKNITKNTQTNINKIDYLISKYKNLAISADNHDEIMRDMRDMKFAKQFLQLYKEYESIMRFNNALDFDDLLLLPYLILKNFEDIRNHISDKYNFIMVDEYQDTNTLQNLLLKMLCANHKNICVVGDDDQSIYGWRGADINNILNFSHDFKGAKEIKLEINYRSKENILQLANNLISFNHRRKNKVLKSAFEGKSENVDLDNIKIIHAKDDKEEIFLIVEEIKKILESNGNYKDIAILFRLNALSRFIEEGFAKYNIPFKLIGVMRFYDRMEIKDIIAYLRLIVNIHDNLSFARVVNRPKRGIGQSSIDKIMTMSKNTSVYENYKNGVFNNEKFFSKLQEFFDFIEHLITLSNNDFSDLISTMKSKIIMYENEIDRVMNMGEFYGYFEDCMKNEYESLQDFLNDLSLDSSINVDEDDSVSCMSVHSSKGLEFKHVFIVGMEDGMFPLVSYDDFNDDNDIEEERRLGYVAITRAKESLYFSYVNSRFYRGKKTFLNKSRFLVEMNARDRFDAKDSNNAHIKDTQQNIETSIFKVGDCVKHAIFGLGKIEQISNNAGLKNANNNICQNIDSNNCRYLVNFGSMKRTLLQSSLKLV